MRENESKRDSKNEREIVRERERERERERRERDRERESVSERVIQDTSNNFLPNCQYFQLRVLWQVFLL